MMIKEIDNLTCKHGWSRHQQKAECTKCQEKSKFEKKIARQLVAMQYPQGKRTNGEMNEDAHFIRQSVYFKNIVVLIDEYIEAIKESKQ